MTNRVATQKDIANSLGVSRGTVDRALHDRPGINSEMKHRVLDRARRLGYSPNKLAQFLVTGRQLTFAIITPGDPLWIKVREGADSFLSELGSWLMSIKWYQTDVHDPERETEYFEEALRLEVDGIGIVPSDPEMFTPFIDRATESGIPVVTINTDAPESRRRYFIGQDPELAGSVAADLLGNFLMGSGKVAIVAAFHHVLVHKVRREAFEARVGRFFSGVEIVGVFESHDSETEVYEITRNLLKRIPDLAGMYLTTGAGIGGVGRALKAAGRAGSVRVVCYDFFSDTVELLKDGTVTAAIGEDPYGQGYQSVKALYRCLVDKKKKKNDGNTLFTRLDIGLRSNIDLLVH